MNTMNTAQRFYLRAAGVMGGLAVVVGAFGAHGLKSVLSDEMLAIYQTGVQYHFYHALALLALALAPPALWHGRSTVWAARLFLIGIVIFSGSLYTLAITEVRWLGAITPFGGLAMIAGWICLAFSVFPNTASE
jgi:uncharacterized membrane protein YgdD (TMEM256/DUF423 family)